MELNNICQTMSARNLIADAKFASVDILEFSEAWLHPPKDSLPLNNTCHGCIHSMRDLKYDQHQIL
jgi:hypothetical protein